MRPREAPTRPPDGSQVAHMRPQYAPGSPPGDTREAGWLCENVDISQVLDTFVKHACTNGLKSCTVLLGGLEWHK